MSVGEETILVWSEMGLTSGAARVGDAFLLAEESVPTGSSSPVNQVRFCTVFQNYVIVSRSAACPVLPDWQASEILTLRALRPALLS